MSHLMTSELSQTVSEWISQQANKMHLAVTVYSQSITLEGNWLNVSVWIDHNGDAYDTASLLQQIEEFWEPDDHDGLQLLLMPTKPYALPQADLYTQITDLMDRQHQLLDIINPDQVDAETAEQLLAVKREWVETRNKANRIVPTAKIS